MIAVAIAATAGTDGDGGGDASPRTVAPPGEEHGHESSIYVLDLRSGGLEQVTEGQIAQQPSWAPDDRITFSAADCDDECWSQLFHVDPKGKNQVLVRGSNSYHLFHPTWSPDGERIAAAALGRGIFAVSADGRTIRRLTRGPTDEAPDWSPRGDLVAFDKRVSGTNYDIFAVDPATRKVRRLTRDPRQQTNPTWSPDGSRFAFAEQEPDGKWAIVTMRADGSGRKRVTGAGFSAQEPAWSPDGSRIAFVKQGLDKAAIAVVPQAGGRVRTVTPARFFASKPAWSPDGKSLAFSGQPVEKEGG